MLYRLDSRACRTPCASHFVAVPLAALGLVSLLYSAGCGSSAEEAQFASDRAPATPTPSASNELSFGGGSDAGTQSSGQDSMTACATVSAPAQIQKVNLVMLLDRSGSMGSKSAVRAQKWTPVTDAIAAFATDTASAGMNASLTFFPDANNSCGAVYGTPNVSRAALPSPAIVTAIAATNPTGSGTPLRSALQGVIAQAAAQRAAFPEERTVIVVATDGQPSGCGISSSTTEVTNIAGDVKAVASLSPTYVIGVGSSLGSLNAIAVAGNTTAAKIVSTGNAATTAQEFLATLQAIRTESVACDAKIPVPPDGRAVDANRVNVKLGAIDIAYSADCSSSGWRFDDVAQPQRVVLCPATCSAGRQGASGLEVAFMCSDVRQVVR
jgi:hypothetical protein